MLHAAFMALVALGLGALTWRASGGRGSGVPAWLALPWTLWLVELGLGFVAPSPVEHHSPVIGRPVTLWEGIRFGSDTVRPLTDTPRVAVVGDSFVAGQGVREPDTLPMQISNRLNARGLSADVLNLGDSGRSFFDEYTFYGALGGSLDPDVVVWVFVLNDLGFQGGDAYDLINLAPPPEPTGVAAVDVVRRGLWARETTRRTTEGYKLALAPQVEGLEQVKRLLTAVADELHARGGRLVFTVYPLLQDLDAYPFHDEHDRLNAIAAESGAEVVDLRPVFAGHDASALWANLLDHHPNAVAQGMAADVLAKALGDGKLPRTGPFDCAKLPPVADLGDVFQAGCRGALMDQVALADKLLGVKRPEHFMPMYTRFLASDLAGRAGVLAEAAGDAATADAARAVVKRSLEQR